MGNIAVKISCVLVFIVSMAACTGKAPEVIEVTRVVPQTVEVTRIAPQTVIATQIVRVTAASTPAPLNAAGETPQPVYIDPAYSDGIIVITQYYTLFAQGLYEEAYQLLSPSRPHANGLEEFISNSEMLKIKKIKIVTINPSNKSNSRFRTQTTPDPIKSKMFYTQIYEEGENGMAGSVKNGTHDYFITVVLENDEWKIYSVNTSP